MNTKKNYETKPCGKRIPKPIYPEVIAVIDSMVEKFKKNQKKETYQKLINKLDESL